jgi:Tol biopolymer transport system component
VSLASGTRIGPYEITGSLGAGGMGEVYRARDRKLSRDVALKMLPAAFARDPDRLARFEREATVLASLNHPNIGAIYGFEEGEGRKALVLELVDGETLADRIARGPCPLEDALPIARQICDALEAAHEHGIVHRDLKPANIKLRPDGVVKVLDFGLAKLAQAPDPGPQASVNALSVAPTVTSPAVTMAGVIMGTAAYMSPDQARGRPADKRADLWAFGCVVYEMLTGRRAFDPSTGSGSSRAQSRDESPEIADTLAFILTKEPDWSALPPTTPSGIRRLLRRCLEKDRKRRLADASDARLEIDEVLSGSFVDTTPTVASAARRDHRAWAQVAIVALVGAAAIAITAMYLTLGAPRLLLTRLDLVTPETTEPFSFALSPDGRRIVFVATDGDRPRLWLRALDQGTAQALTGTEGANWPFWAPDGRDIGFFANGKLKRLSLGGGTPQELAVAIQARGGTWSADGVIVFAGLGVSSLMQVPAGGGEAVPVTTLLEGQQSHRWPQFLPDGRRFIFSAALGQQESRGVYVGSLDGLAPTRILEIDTSALYAPPGFLLYVSNETLFARRFDASAIAVTGEPMAIARGVGMEEGLWLSGFSISNAGVLAHRGGTSPARQLVWVNRNGKMLRTMKPGAGVPLASIAHPAVSPDGRYVAFGGGGNRDIWLMSVDNGVTSRFTTHDALDFTPLWSPDGKRIVFRSIRARDGVFDLFEKPADGAADEQLLFSNELNKSPTDWSRNGRFLLYAEANPKGASDLWALPMTEPADARKTIPVAATSFDEIQGQFSPNGRWIAYVSNESGRYDVFVKPFLETGGRIAVSPAGGTSPRWSHDGAELFYVAADNQLMVVPIRPGRDSRALGVGTPMALFPTHLAAGGNLPSGGFNSAAQYTVTPEGFLMNVTAEDSVTSPINIVLNWTAALGK